MVRRRGEGAGDEGEWSCWCLFIAVVRAVVLVTVVRVLSLTVVAQYGHGCVDHNGIQVARWW